MLNYVVSYLIIAGIYAIAALALNLQWGFTGLMNFGIGAFYMVGAYTSAILTTPASQEYLGGFDLPILIGVLCAMGMSGIIAYVISIPALKLRGGTFAIAGFELSTDEFEAAWNMVYGGWLPESGYQPDDRLCYEMYHNNCNEHPEKKSIVDICVPVKPM